MSQNQTMRSRDFFIELWGARACFTRPELKVERVSYDFITPTAARGVIESIFWHPGMKYKIDTIVVMNEIRNSEIRRNEFRDKGSQQAMVDAINGKRALPHFDSSVNQRASVILRDVRYQLKFHFDIYKNGITNPGKLVRKYESILQRRMSKGQFFSEPYLGTREFPAFFKSIGMIDNSNSFYYNGGVRGFGLVLYDLDFSDENDVLPSFFHAVMNGGIIEVAKSEVYQ